MRELRIGSEAVSAAGLAHDLRRRQRTTTDDLEKLGSVRPDSVADLARQCRDLPRCGSELRDERSRDPHPNPVASLRGLLHEWVTGLVCPLRPPGGRPEGT